MIHTQFQSQRYNGVSEATTIRQPSTALLTIDSADRFADQVDRRYSLVYDPRNKPRNFSAYDFTITKNESIMNGFFTRIGVSEVVFPWSIPNINSQTNKMTVRVDNSGVITDYSGVLQEGFYTPYQLAAAIQTQVRLVPGLSGFVMDYSPRPFTNSFVYDTNNIAIDIAFLPIPYTNAVYSNNTQILQLFDLMGFTDDNSILAPGGVGVATLCQFTRYIDIVCNQLTYNQALKDTSSQRTVRDALCRVYLGDGDTMTTATVAPTDVSYCPPGCAPLVLYRNYSQPKQIQWAPNQPVPGYLTFQVYDDNGILLSDVGSSTVSAGSSGYGYAGLDWSMTMLVSEN
jgi:hypothetical protein